MFDGARSLVWVYGWAPDLIRSTDTIVTTRKRFFFLHRALTTTLIGPCYLRLASIGACPYQPDAPARVSTDQMTRHAHYQTRRVNEGQRDGAVRQGLDARHAHYQPDAQTREPEVLPPLDGPGIFPSLARRVGVFVHDTDH
jgi:hypothetical protein